MEIRSWWPFIRYRTSARLSLRDALKTIRSTTLYKKRAHREFRLVLLAGNGRREHRLIGDVMVQCLMPALLILIRLTVRYPQHGAGVHS
ncbi:MAG: hypothetical protein ABI128_01070 [Rhodanobacter sp.]